jgi:hypothetical protein
MWRFPDAQYVQRIRQPGAVRRLTREEIEREYPARVVCKDSHLTMAYREPCEKGQEQVYIYGLADPRDHVIRYVGKTSLPLGARLDWHMKEPTNQRMAEWLCELEWKGIRPEIAVLEICHVTKWENTERMWIARLRAVSSMLNVEPGGESHRG